MSFEFCKSFACILRQRNIAIFYICRAILVQMLNPKRFRIMHFSHFECASALHSWLAKRPRVPLPSQSDNWHEKKAAMEWRLSGVLEYRVAQDE
jgi:hypothetical protein